MTEQKFVGMILLSTGIGLFIESAPLGLGFLGLLLFLDAVMG